MYTCVTRYISFDIHSGTPAYQNGLSSFQMIRRFRCKLANFEVTSAFRCIIGAMKRKRKTLQLSSDEEQGCREHVDEQCSAARGGEVGESYEGEALRLKLNCDAEKEKAQTSKPRKKTLNVAVDPQNPFHFFTDDSDVGLFRQNMLQWYDANKRDLPWREWASHPDSNQRAYAVWVSEIMLQQTQVATVIDYYNRWMEKWPTLADLATSATTEEVNEMWAGLGYYSRGRRLYEGAKKVQEELSGIMPNDVESLMKQLPGVGRYTAGAIASIAFSEPTGVVDGNVIRVLSRTRAIGADSTSQTVQSAIWSLANGLVDRQRPGDFNQSLMELGATICTPKAPSCAKCPIRTLCRAYQHEEKLKRSNEEKVTKEFIRISTVQPHPLPDIECAADSCQLCIPACDEWDVKLGVMNFPRKPKKKPPRIEQTAVCIVQKNGSETKYLLVQRPETGLLAGLWEFPSVKIQDKESIIQRNNAIDAYLTDQLKFKIAEKSGRRSVGEVVHIFSHIEQTYFVETFKVHDKDFKEKPKETRSPYRWLTAEDLWTGAISTAMKKCFAAYEKALNSGKVKSKKMKLDSGSSGDGKKQSALNAFFKPVARR